MDPYPHHRRKKVADIDSQLIFNCRGVCGGHWIPGVVQPKSIKVSIIEAGLVAIAHSWHVVGQQGVPEAGIVLVWNIDKTAWL